MKNANFAIFLALEGKRVNEVLRMVAVTGSIDMSKSESKRSIKLEKRNIA